MKVFFSFLIISSVFCSCTSYQKALKSDDVGLKFHLADSLYEAGKYKKALKLMEQIVPAYRGKPQAEKLMYLYADTFYQLGDNYLSGYQFDRFSSMYPSSDKVEEARFKAAKSYYLLSPRYSLEQKETYTALEKLQQFINSNPDSEFINEANKLVAELTQKLEKKSFEIAMQYNKVRDYKAAIRAFDNFIRDYPGSKYRMEAYFYRLHSAHLLAINSISQLVDERLVAARGYYNSFNRYYSQSEKKSDADAILQDIETRLQNKKG